MKIICQYSENRAAKYMIIDNGQFFVLLLFQMAKNAQKSNKFLLVLLVAVALAIPVTLALISNRTSLTQQATSYPDLNRVEEIVTTNNPDGTMGPPSWLNNFAQTLPAYQKGQLAFFVTDPPPSGVGNRKPTITLPPQAKQGGVGGNASGSGGRGSQGPRAVISLTLTISKVEVHLAYLGNPQDKTVASPSTDRWETLNVPNPTTVDLVQLAATGNLSSLGTTALAAGRYTEVRLYVTSASATLEDGTVVTLTIPGNNNIVRVVRTFTIVAGQTKKLTMDFDAQHSVIKTADQYILKPVVAKLIEN
ncbi:MAG: hypothetical protein A3C27_02215 [Candidatus Levybacteria bacterium RIFCSPHIGHO2_02_FULL_39_36]|nr:MAG: hypothetical protein UT20_C0007G0016 [Candidatus Levybacteria bacterium GW2011_GWA1_39_11]OGH15273.1 MAG: hypothetical protein A2689_00635 [Candidatus Levybacteria bacterium RIFCSPHIGHO2_01_FULL_38_96]OGH28134.1 MAG: hypothetical protein A3C27_02215 [Candidatus Levybacteria bacterium RIFCSPHIGHO2_02_FULL_39_36]OGH36180.1 MAG: hypothetical protein A3B43_02025 [Candidatus Levybacteria bacterium RIFCSPLOWO2_01_FULL_38_120]OGH45250.1 MAG: hypothetical protein A3H82_01705 [Candidatus Levybac